MGTAVLCGTKVIGRVVEAFIGVAFEHGCFLNESAVGQ